MSAGVDTRQLRELRRDLRRVAPEVGRQLDRELRAVGADVAREAAGNSRRRTGRFARGWKVSVTAKNAVAVRNTTPYGPQQEYGRKIWIRRGRPYRQRGRARSPLTVRGRRGALQVRQRPAGAGMVVNEAQILIPRSAPGRRAVNAQLPRSRARIAAATRDAAARALA